MKTRQGNYCVWPTFLSVIISVYLPLSISGASPDARETQFIENPRQLILAGKRSGEGYFSKDGTKLVFQAERDASNPFFQIYSLDLTNGDMSRVSPGIGKTTCSFFHPDGTKILFASTHHDPQAIEKQKTELEMRASGKERRYSWDYDETMDIFSVPVSGSTATQLTNSKGYDAEGSYSPDGQWIAFCSVRHAFPKDQLSPELQKRYEIDPSYFGDIYLMRSDGSQVRRLTRHEGYDGGPFFSPDGKRIVWRRFDEEGVNADIMTMNLQGRDVRQITQDFGMAWAPYYHPSNEYIIFTSNREGFSNFELYIVDRLGYREPVQVSFTDGFDGLPVFSPDGTTLVWTSNRYAAQPGSKDKGHLFISNWNHEAARLALRKSPIRQKTKPKSAKQITGGRFPSKPPIEVEAAPGIAAERTIQKEIKEPELSPLITEKDLKKHVHYLASDALEGRMTGEKGSRLAAEYIAKSLKQIGIQPMTSLNGYYQPFDFTAGVEVNNSATSLSWSRETDTGAQKSLTHLELESGFRPLAFSSNGDFSGELVFAGYGLKVPGEGIDSYNSYAGLNISNKVALILRYVPEGVSSERRAVLNRYAALRYKAMIARELGAKGILIVSGPNSPNTGKLIPMKSDQSLGNSGILAASITADIADSWLSSTGQTLKKLQTGLDQENPHALGSLEMPDTKVQLSIQLNRLRKSDNNVIGILHPPHPDSRKPDYIMLGAHYDHLGLGEVGGFNAKGEEKMIHNGADDNASGVASVLEMAGAIRQQMMHSPTSIKQGVIFGFWSGEELGLIGSTHFANQPPIALERIHAYLNFDMVGRLRENRLTLQGIGSSDGWKPLIERGNVVSGFQLILQEDPYLPTDTTAFYPKGIPVLSFFTGSHEEYHRPGDDTHTLNWKGLLRITQFASNTVKNLIKNASPGLSYAKVAPSQNGGQRDTLRVYLGTIPDYTSETEGVKLTGVRAEGPADKAGLKAGDIITSLAKQPIKNIYDYTYALDAATIGKPTEITILRNNVSIKKQITPAARP
jgi:Tol biopolymer transport system component